jgi:hypothetical protein
MATPHVAGLMALILEAKPGLNADQIKNVLESSALDLGTAGKDTTFGSGRVRADKAVQTATLAAESRLEITKELTFSIEPDGSINTTFIVDNPFWQMKVRAELTILEPAGTYNGSFIFQKTGKPDQTGEIVNVTAGVPYLLSQTFTLYTDTNTVAFIGKYSGSSTATQGKAIVKIKTV